MTVLSTITKQNQILKVLDKHESRILSSSYTVTFPNVIDDIISSQGVILP